MLVARCVPALLAAAAAAQLLHPRHTLLVAAAAMCALSPVPAAVRPTLPMLQVAASILLCMLLDETPSLNMHAQVVDFAAELRLNEGFAAAVASLSQAASLVLLTALALISASLAPPPLTTAEVALARGPPPGPFAAAACVLAAVVLGTAAVLARAAAKYRRGSGSGAEPRGAVRMTLRGNPPPVPELNLVSAVGQVGSFHPACTRGVLQEGLPQRA